MSAYHRTISLPEYSLTGALVYVCISEDKVWTTIVNDLPAQSSVSAGSRPEDKTVLTLNYSMSAEQVMLKTV